VWIPKAHDSNPQTPFSLGSDKKSKFNGRERENAVDMIDRSIRRFDYPMTIMNNGGHVCKGGFWDGKIAFCPVEGTNSTGFELIGHKTTVSSLVCDKKEHTIISGSKSGEVIVWRNSNFDCSVESCSSANPWVNMKQVDDHQRQITSIFINDEMNLFVTGSLDGTANMYNLWTAKRLRTFSHPILFPIQNVVLA
jgi:WD40 repeat protein